MFLTQAKNLNLSIVLIMQSSALNLCKKGLKKHEEEKELILQSKI